MIDRSIEKQTRAFLDRARPRAASPKHRARFPHSRWMLAAFVVMSAALFGQAMLMKSMMERQVIEVRVNPEGLPLSWAGRALDEIGYTPAQDWTADKPIQEHPGYEEWLKQQRRNKVPSLGFRF